MCLYYYICDHNMHYLKLWYLSATVIIIVTISNSGYTISNCGYNRYYQAKNRTDRCLGNPGSPT